MRKFFVTLTCLILLITSVSLFGCKTKEDQNKPSEPVSPVYTLTFSTEIKDKKSSNQTVTISGDTTLIVYDGKTLGDRLPTAASTDTDEYRFSGWVIYVGDKKITITKDTVFNSTTLGLDGTTITVYPEIKKVYNLRFNVAAKGKTDAVVVIEGESIAKVCDGELIGSVLPKTKAIDDENYALAYWVVYLDDTEIKLSLNECFEDSMLESFNAKEIDVYPVLKNIAGKCAYNLTFSSEDKDKKASNQTVDIIGEVNVTIYEGESISDKLPKATATDAEEYKFSNWVMYIGDKEITITKDTVFDSTTLSGLDGTEITVYPVLTGLWIGPY